jgi:hypothetical protein
MNSLEAPTQPSDTTSSDILLDREEELRQCSDRKETLSASREVAAYESLMEISNGSGFI